MKIGYLCPADTKEKTITNRLRFVQMYRVKLDILQFNIFFVSVNKPNGIS